MTDSRRMVVRNQEVQRADKAQRNTGRPAGQWEYSTTWEGWNPEVLLYINYTSIKLTLKFQGKSEGSQEKRIFLPRAGTPGCLTYVRAPLRKARQINSIITLISQRSRLTRGEFRACPQPLGQDSEILICWVLTPELPGAEQGWFSAGVHKKHGGRSSRGKWPERQMSPPGFCKNINVCVCSHAYLYTHIIEIYMPSLTQGTSIRAR